MYLVCYVKWSRNKAANYIARLFVFQPSVEDLSRLSSFQINEICFKFYQKKKPKGVRDNHQLKNENFQPLSEAGKKRIRAEHLLLAWSSTVTAKKTIVELIWIFCWAVCIWRVILWYLSTTTETTMRFSSLKVGYHGKRCQMHDDFLTGYMC